MSETVKGRGRKAGPRTLAVGARYDERLVELLDRQVERTRRTRSIELSIALEEYLERKGYVLPWRQPRPAEES